ncbi:MAG: porin family protein [Planctomycetota bacterium]
MHRLGLVLLLLCGSVFADIELEAEAYLERATYAESAAGGPKGWASLRAMAWYPALRGSGNDDGGGNFDFRDDLGLDDNELTLVPQLTVNFWIFGFRVDYFDVQYTGSGVLRNDVTIGGVTFPAGTQVDSKVTLTNFRSLGFLRFLDTDHVRLFGIIGLNAYHYEATLSNGGLGPAQVDGTLPFPVIGLLIQVRVGDFLFEGEGSGFSIDWSGVEATALDFALSAAWSFLKFGELRAGYRWISLDGTFDTTTLDLRLDGFFVSLGVNF